MRVGVWRGLVCTAVVGPAVAAGALAQPPLAPAPTPADKTTDTAAERAKLQADLLILLKRISVAPTPVTYPAGPMSPPGAKPKIEPGVGSKGPDPIREGMNLFRDGDFEGARRTFQLIDPVALPKEDRAFVRYMLACCLRRQGKPAEAEVIYREVANGGDDEFLVSCAIWQLSLIRSEQELQTQLEQLRARAKSK
jgi:hypothetical protein